MPRKLTYTLLLCVALCQLANADVIITAPVARTAISKLDTLDYLRSGAKIDSARVANLLNQVSVQEKRNLETAEVLTKAVFNLEQAEKKTGRLQAQKNAWRMTAYISTAVAAVLGGLLYFIARR